MEIIQITENNVCEAGRIHSESWKESHKGFCTGEFIDRHTTEAQTEYIQSEMDKGKAFYMLVDHKPVGIVSVQESLIENLYILPTEQRKGYGAMLLQYILQLCDGIPHLWILSNNERADAFYKKHGFIETGKRKQLRNDLFEIELVYTARGKEE